MLATSGWRGRGAAAAPIYSVKQRAFNPTCLQGTKIGKQIDCVKQMLTHLQPQKHEKNTPNPHIPAVTPISSSQTHVAAVESGSMGRSWWKSEQDAFLISGGSCQRQLILGMTPPLSVASPSPPRLLLHPAGLAGWLLLIGTGQAAPLPFSPPGKRAERDKDPLAPALRRGGKEAPRTHAGASQGPSGIRHPLCHQPEGTSRRSHPPTRLSGTRRPGMPVKAKINIK